MPIQGGRIIDHPPMSYLKVEKLYFLFSIPARVFKQLSQ
jgi:hypothetical protein